MVVVSMLGGRSGSINLILVRSDIRWNSRNNLIEFNYFKKVMIKDAYYGKFFYKGLKR
jgi:hypothetical protein